MCGCRLVRREIAAQLRQLQAQRGDIARRGKVDAGADRTTPLRVLRTLDLELLQHLAHQRAADAELLCQSVFVNEVPRRISQHPSLQVAEKPGDSRAHPKDRRDNSALCDGNA